MMKASMSRNNLFREVFDIIVKSRYLGCGELHDIMRCDANFRREL
jgi:hypothetical protein